MVKPGVHWDTVHLHAYKVLIDEFLSFGIFKGDPEAILQSGITVPFCPHGLGHSLGLDVHDSRQYLKSTHIDLPPTSKTTPAKLYTYLRVRQPLQKGMVLTVEPGIYFAPQLMEENGVWTSKYVDQDKLREYVAVGGVRIEDAVVVTEDGCENLTTVGRERAWVEAVCSGES
jgi:Xaa-Pro dipeptidase